MPNLGAGMALACELGQGGPFPASPEDRRRLLLPCTSLHTPTSTGNRGNLRSRQVLSYLQEVCAALSPREAAFFFSPFINVGFYFIFVINPT